MKVFSIILVLIVIFSFRIFSQSFEGKVIMNSGLVGKETLVNDSSNVIEYFVKNRHLRMDARNASNNVKVTTLYLLDESKIISYANVNGDSIMNVDTLSNGIESGDQFIELKETRDIAGYNCNKGLYIKEERGKKIEIEIWYTNEIPNNLQFQFPKLSGMPMEYSYSNGLMVVNLRVVSVINERLNESIFVPPVGYLILNRSDFRKAAMGW